MATQITEKKDVSRKQLANHFGVDPDTVYRWQKSGLVKISYTVNNRPRYNLDEAVKSVTQNKQADGE